MPDNNPTERPPVPDAEFEETNETGDGGETQRDTEAIVLVTQDAAARLSAISKTLQGHVPDEVVREIQFLGNFALATARNQTDFERRLAEIRAAQEGRDRALALILVGGNLSELDIEGREKAPDKLRPLEIETPDTMELVDERITVTLTNPNGVKV